MAKERKCVEYKDKKIFVRRPTVEEGRLANIEYGKALSKFLKEGLPLQAELDKILRDRGVLQDLDARYEVLEKQIEEAMIKLTQEENEEKKILIRRELTGLRNEAIAIDTARRQHAQYTAEGQADETRLAFLIQTIAENEDGSKFWASLDVLKQEDDQELVVNVARSFFLLSRGLSENFLEEFDQDLNKLVDEVQKKKDEIKIEEQVEEKEEVKTS